jgi:hypothetical protein
MSSLIISFYAIAYTVLYNLVYIHQVPYQLTFKIGSVC